MADTIYPDEEAAKAAVECYIARMQDLMQQLGITVEWGCDSHICAKYYNDRGGVGSYYSF